MNQTKLTGLLILLISIFLFEISLLAGTKGKIVGIVTDQNSGKSLPYVNVYLKDVNLGATTDDDGYYIILNVPPGNYSLVVQHLGYITREIANVDVVADLTLTINVKLEETSIESGESVTVVADRPLIRPDVTSKLAVIDGKDITTMPVEDFNEVLASQAGITTDQNGNLHLRGGRINEISYLIDGQPVENPLDNSFSGLIDNYAIQELQVLSGTFNAEYGSAMSGIINIITNEGSEKIRTKIEYTSPVLNNRVYRKPNALVEDANPIYDRQNNLRLTYRDVNAVDNAEPLYPYEGSFTGYLSGPLLKNIGNFFVSGEYKNENSWLPFGYNLARSAFGKLSFPLGPHKFTISTQISNQEKQPYNHLFKYLPNSMGHWEIESIRYGIQYNHVFSPISYLTINASYQDQQSLFLVDDLHYTQYVFPELAVEQEEFYIAGNSKTYSDLSVLTYNMKADWLVQLNTNHEIKSGVELNQYDLDVFDYTNEGNDPEEFFLNRYGKKPVSASIYLQDKIEYSTIIINAGLRGDYVDVKGTGYKDLENPLSGLKETEPEFKLSPRLGLAYPVTESTVLHFSYGHFFQFPNFQEIYRNLQFLDVNELSRATFALVANPTVKSQKTIAYEIGISQKLSNNYALNISAYSRDITDLLGTIIVNTFTDYAIFTNNDFARIQGVDISLEKRMKNYWSARFDYSYSVARGSEASPTEEASNIFNKDEPRSVKEFYLSFDRTHDFAMNLMLQLPPGFGPDLFGIRPLQRLNFSVLAQFSSGLPYTPISDDLTKIFEKNSARMPWTNTVDIRLEKFLSAKRFNFSVFLEVDNLFDRLNPLRVQPRTGQVWDDGKSRLFGSGEDTMHDPSDVGPPRIVKMGLSIAL